MEMITRRETTMTYIKLMGIDDKDTYVNIDHIVCMFEVAYGSTARHGERSVGTQIEIPAGQYVNVKEKVNDIMSTLIEDGALLIGIEG